MTETKSDGGYLVPAEIMKSGWITITIEKPGIFARFARWLGGAIVTNTYRLGNGIYHLGMTKERKWFRGLEEILKEYKEEKKK